MLRKESEAVLEGNGPIPQQQEFESGQPMLEDAFREIREEWKKQMDKIKKYVMQELASQAQDARQPRLAIEADGPANMKTRERTEGAALAVQAMHGDSCTAQKIQDGLKTSISFGVKAEPPDLPCREDILVEDGAAAPKSCLPFLEMRTKTAADGLVPTGKTSTTTETTSNQRASSSVLHERGDESKGEKFMDFNSIRLVRQQLLETASCPLLPKGHGDRIRRKYDVRFRWISRSSPRLPVFGIVARVALW